MNKAFQESLELEHCVLSLHNEVVRDEIRAVGDRVARTPGEDQMPDVGKEEWANMALQKSTKKPLSQSENASAQHTISRSNK